MAPAVLVCELPTTAGFSDPATSTLDPAYYNLSAPALKGLTGIVRVVEPGAVSCCRKRGPVDASLVNVRCRGA